MKLLLDTITWIWSLGATQRLNQDAQDLLADPAQELYLSAASAWEIAIKTALGKINFPESPQTLIPREMARMGIRPLPVNHIHALAVLNLPLYHADAFDRLLIAQARTEELTLLTANHDIRKYDVSLFWAGKEKATPKGGLHSPPTD